MKKFLVFVLIAIIIISVVDIEPTYAARSVRVSVSGLEKMKVGQSATFSVRIDFTDCLKIEAEIYLQPTSCLSGGENWRWNSTSGKNESGYIEDSITVKAVGSGEGFVTANVVATYYVPDGGGVSEIRSFDTVLVRVSAPATPAPTAAPTAPPAPPAPGATAAPTAKSGSSSQNTKPTPTPNANELKDWNQVQYMMSHSGGSDISFDMGKNKHEIPRNVLGLLKGQDSCLTVNFGEYECMLDGSKIEDLDRKLKNLDLSFNTKNNKTLSTLLGGVDAFQFHFNHDGAPIPCPITYKVLADGYKRGDELYLYYHDEEEKCLEAISRHTVDKDGYVSFAVPHFSSYALTAEMIDTAENNSVFYTPTPVPTDTPEPTDTPSPAPTEKPTSTPTLSPTPLPTETETADNKNTSNILLIILCIGVLISVAFVVFILFWYGKQKEGE